MPEQAAYDVTFYDLDLAVLPDQRSINGALTVRARVVHPMHRLVLNLDTLLRVERVEEILPAAGSRGLEYRREGGLLLIHLDTTRQRGEHFSVRVAYGGQPRVAPRPPWDGGFSWETTPSGAPWIATSCQINGADVWWPCKDHVSDEPDSMALHIRVPEPLVVAANGRLLREEPHDDATVTYHWFISQPINIYNVALNIAPYRLIRDERKCVDGSTYPIHFYVLPEDYQKGLNLMPEIKDHLRFFESYLGPYPFRADKYGIAQTPHLGMEHQSIIAYGANFNNASMTRGKDWGFDALHHHELAHEWWGNLITNYDWRDMWIHEGFGSYMQPLYLEDTQGKAAYHEYLKSQRFFSGQLAVAPRTSQLSTEIYRAPIYTKGSWTLHTLRYLVGEEDFFEILRRFAYPTPALEQVTDGSQTRFVTTDDFLHLCESIAGRDLDWFFEVYLRQPQLPVLRSRIEGNTLRLKWETPLDMKFPMPVDVQLGDETRRVDIPPGGVEMSFPAGVKPVVDPEDWVLKELGSW